MELLLVNIASPRRVSEGNREYLVAPLTLIVPGVLNGSQGPLYYPPEEIQRTVSAWNEVPITLQHPRKDGNLVSAKDGGIKLGTIRNARYEDKLVADGWFDIAALNEQNPQLLGSIESGKEGELSTGLYTDNKPVKNGEYNGHNYTHVATNYRPDHLAILSDETGACSVNDGCGVNVNQTESTWMGTTGKTRDHTHYVEVDKDGYGWARFEQGHGHEIATFVVLPQKYPEQSSDGHKHSLNQESLQDTGLYNQTISNAEEGDMPLAKEQRKKLVDNLLGCCWEETDRPVLEKLTDNQLTRLDKDAKEAEALTLVANTARETLGLPKDFEINQMPEALKKALVAKKKVGDDDEDEEGNPVKKKTENKLPDPPKPLTKEEWLAQAPEGVREDLDFAHNEKAKQRCEAIAAVTANLNGDEKTKVEKHLEGLALEQIKDLTVLVPKPRPAANYATVPSAGNEGQKEPPMGIRTWNFEQPPAKS